MGCFRWIGADLALVAIAALSLEACATHAIDHSELVLTPSQRQALSSISLDVVQGATGRRAGQISTKTPGDAALDAMAPLGNCNECGNIVGAGIGLLYLLFAVPYATIKTAIENEEKVVDT